MWMKPKSAPTVIGLADNLHEDQSILLIDGVGSPSWDIHGTQWGIFIWFLGEFEHTLDGSTNTKDGV